MIKHENVESYEEPQSVVVDEYSVWVASEIETKQDAEGETVYTYNLVQYTKDEYIALLDERDKMKSDALIELSDMVAGLMGGE